MIKAEHEMDINEAQYERKIELTQLWGYRKNAKENSDNDVV